MICNRCTTLDSRLEAVEAENARKTKALEAIRQAVEDANFPVNTIYKFQVDRILKALKGG